MKQASFFVAILFVILCVGTNLPSLYAQDNPNTITFDNKSGEPALVKLIGPTGQTVAVPNGQSRTVNIGAGKYYILMRYGSKPDQYSYSKGNPFTVTQTATQYSAITITLHKVIGGDYATHPISAEEFGNVAEAVKTQFTGTVKGLFLGEESQRPLARVGIILCRISTEGECDIQADIVTITDNQGRFSLSHVPSGSYVVLYDRYGKAMAAWKSIDCLRIDYKLGPPREHSVITEEFFNTFGGGNGVIIRKGTKATFEDGKIVSINGSFTSPKYSLTIDFHEGKPLIFQVQKGQTTQLEIKAWGL